MTLVDDMHLVDELPMGRTLPGAYTENHRNRARERILDKKIAYGLLVRADRNRYGKLIEEVENSFLKGNNDYPNTPLEAYNLLVNYKNFNLHKRGAPEGGLDQVAFMTEGKKLKPNGNFLHIKCYKCGKFGHYKSDCKEKKNQEKEGEAKTTEFCQVITVTALMTQAMWVQKKEEIDLLWILCDNESTIDIIKNQEMITNIRKTKNPIALTGIGGEPMKIVLEGDLVGYGTVYHHPKIAANILSFYRMTK
jgi:hypothetical protein